MAGLKTRVPRGLIVVDGYAVIRPSDPSRQEHTYPDPPQCVELTQFGVNERIERRQVVY
jgi:hypothetical protein